MEYLQQCIICGTYWFLRFHEYMRFDGPDDQIEWCSPLTEEEGELIKDPEERPDLYFLRERRCIKADREGIREVKGQPDNPYL